MNCKICINEVKTGVVCFKCQEISCRTCTQKYLYQVEIPKCMFCGITWDLEFVALNTDVSFHNGSYREKRAKILLERERSLLINTQPVVRHFLEEKKLENIRTQYKREIILLRQCKEEAEKRFEKEPYACLESDLYSELIRYFNTKLGNVLAPEIVVEKFLGFCPQNDCRGFLEKGGKCGLCENQACPDCRRPIHSGACNKDDLASIQQIESNCRPCPDCKIPVYKISGCDQMFCVKSHTFFSWETGLKLDPKIKHNPHYYEYRKRNPAVKPQKTCEPVDYDLLMACVEWDEKISVLYQRMEHYRSELPKYRTTEYDSKTYEQLRIQYLLKEISEKQWLSALKKMEKKREKDRAIFLVLSMMVETMQDIFNNVIQGANCSIMEQFNGLVQYTNSCLQNISKRFNNKVPNVLL